MRIRSSDIRVPGSGRSCRMFNGRKAPTALVCWRRGGSPSRSSVASDITRSSVCARLRMPMPASWKISSPVYPKKDRNTRAGKGTSTGPAGELRRRITLRCFTNLRQRYADGFLGPEQIAECFARWPRLSRRHLAWLNQGPQLAPDRLRQNCFQILERRAAKMGIVGMERMKRQPERALRQYQRQQGEEMFQASAHPIAQELDFHRGGLLGWCVDQLPAFPDGPLDGDLPENDLKDSLAIDGQTGNVLRHMAENPARTIAHFESPIRQGLEQSFE